MMVMTELSSFVRDWAGTIGKATCQLQSKQTGRRLKAVDVDRCTVRSCVDAHAKPEMNLSLAS